MNIAARLLKLLIVFACSVFSTAALGQVTQIWTGGGDGTNIDQAANWGGALPSAFNNDTGEFNGLTTNNLFLFNDSPQLAGGPGQLGINIYMSGNQTNSVNISTTLQLSQGFAVWNTTIDAGAGPFSYGSTNPAHVFYMPQRPSGAVHTYLNNSTNAATLNPYIRYISGGGAAYSLVFAGSGNWQVNNYLQADNGGGGVSIRVDGPGTTTWNPSGYFGFDQLGTITINGGALVLTAPHSKLTGRPIVINGGAFNFNAPAQAQTLSGTISGAGTNMITAGTLTLSGANTYIGHTVLAGGELIANHAENAGSAGPLGVGNIIDFNGGTLGYSVNNTFDYSSRFSTAPSQAYNIDTAGQLVTYASALTSSGGSLAKNGGGTLTLSGANTYSGPTTVNAGKLVIQGSAGTGSITVADGAALGFTENGSTQIKPSTLTLGTSASVIMEFNNVTNTTLPPLAVSGAITTPVGSPVTININSGQFNTIGQVFPLFSWGSGTPPAVTLGSISGAAGTLSTNAGNTILLTITSTPYVWTGGTNATWDKTTAGNWNQSGTSKTFIDGVLALFDDTALVNTNVTIIGLVQPLSLTFDNDIHAYTVNSSTGNDISGTTGLTMSGAGSVTLTGGANTYTGVTTVSSGGTLSVGSLANGGSPSDIGQSTNSAASLVLNGGILQYTGGDAAIDRLFSIGSAGATIDASGTGSLSLTNTGTVGFSGAGTRTLTLDGSTSNLLAGNLVDSPGNGTALTKHGTGVWALTGTNTYSGGTLINQGCLQIGVGDVSGTIGNGNIVDNTSIDFMRIGTLTVPGNISGSGAVTNNGAGTVILAGSNTYSGGTYINAGTLQFGNAGVGGAVNGNAPIVVNGTVIFNSTTSITLSGFGGGIRGTGNVIVRSGFVNSESANTYTGWTEIGFGATFQPCKGVTGPMLTSVITNNGTLKLLSQNDPPTFCISNNIVGLGLLIVDTSNDNSGLVRLAGTNTYTGGTFIAGAGIILGDGIKPNGGTLAGDVIFTNTSGPTVNFFGQNRRLIFNRFDDFIFTNTITSRVSDGSSIFNSGSIQQMGPGMVTVTGSNSFPAGTTIDGGMTMQVGDGGSTGSIGTGPVVDNGTLIFNRSGTLNVPGAFSGSGSVVKQGPGTVMMAGTNINPGAITVSNGTLRISTLYQGNAPISVRDDATLSVTNTGGGVSALVASLTLGNAAGPSTVEFLNVADPTTKILNHGTLTVNGNATIQITGSGGLVAGNTYPLIGYTGTVGGSGTFSLALPAGVTGTLTNDAVNSWIALNVTTATFAAPAIQSTTLSGTNIVIIATNNLGYGSETYALLSSTNIATPLTNWSMLSTGSFNPEGSLSITNPVGPGRRFFILRAP